MCLVKSTRPGGVRPAPGLHRHRVIGPRDGSGERIRFSPSRHRGFRWFASGVSTEIRTFRRRRAHTHRHLHVYHTRLVRSRPGGGGRQFLLFSILIAYIKQCLVIILCIVWFYLSPPPIFGSDYLISLII